MTDPYTAFRSLHVPGRPLLLPNAWDHASAAMLAADGFTAVGTTSLGVAAAAGKPDAAGATRAETLALARTLRTVPALISVDVEGGFAERPDAVAALVTELADAGVAGVNIEDGRPDGTLRAAAEHAAVIAAVKTAVPEMFVNARTDVFWLGHGGGEHERVRAAADRLTAYAAAGADGVFAPGVAEDGAIAALAQVGVPLNVLFLPGRHTLPRLAELGVARVSLGSLLLRAALAAVTGTARAVRDGARDVAADAPAYRQIAELPARAPRPDR